MSVQPASDPVFGEVARALEPRAGVPTGHTARWLEEVGWLEVTFRAAALDIDDRRKLESMRALSFRPDGRSTLGCPRFALSAFSPLSPALQALLSAHDNAARPPRPPRLMGVVNVTPDSFSDRGRHFAPELAIEHGTALVAAGAAILDIGGESTRPGATPIDAAEELRRVIPVVSGLARATKGVQLSIDTTKHAVARAALDAGAVIVNDISAGRFDQAMLPLVAERKAHFIAMHMLGTPRDMQVDPRYEDVVGEVLEFLRARAAACLEVGIAADRIWIDPGIGFGKRLEHNLELLRRTADLRTLGLPIVLGVSRKSFIAALHPASTNDTERSGGTAAALTVGVMGGAEVFRVHDVALMSEALAVARALGHDPHSNSAR